MKITVDEVKDRLRGIALFRSLGDQYINQLAEKVKYELHPPGSVIVRQGEQGEALYIIHSGEVKVWVSDARGEAITRARVLAGNVFGLAALLTRAPRNATVETVTVTELLRLSKYDFDRLLAEHPGLHHDIIILPRTRKRLRGVRLFSRLSEKDMERVAKLVGIVYYPRGSTVRQEGEIGTSFYIIDSGELRSFTSEEIARGEAGRRLKEGDAFGEISLLAGKPCDATVQVIQDAELLYINKADFHHLLNEYPHLRKMLNVEAKLPQWLSAKRFSWQSPDEVTAWFSRKHWYVLARSIFWPGLLLSLLLGTATALSLFGMGVELTWGLIWIPSLVLATILVGWLLWNWYNWINDFYVITNRRVVHVEVIQFLSSRLYEARLDKIQDVDVSVGFIGGLLGFGHIRVGVGLAGSVTFSYIPVPERAKELILAQKAEAHRIIQRMILTELISPPDHPLCANARRFLERANFTLTLVAEPLVYRCQPKSAELQRLLPSSVYAQFLPGEALDGDQVLAIRNRVRQVDDQISVVFTITDQRPTDQGWAQIGTLRMGSFIVLPIESTLLNEGLATGRERALLRTEIERRLGADYDPYDVRDPVAGAFSFFGRDALVGTLLRRVAEGRPVGIFGLRKMGKSSLLHALRDRTSFPVAAVNLQTVGSDPLNGLYMRILRYWRQWAHVRYEMDWDPTTIVSGNPTSAFVAATLDLLDRIEREQGEARLGLFLDEVELIVPRPDGGGPSLTRYLTLLRALRGLIDEDSRLSLVVSSLNPSINHINAWNDEQNPTFNLFQEIYLSPLEEDDCNQMVSNIGRQIGLVYSEESLQAISDLSGGHPFLARQLCSLLYKKRGYQAGLVEANEVPPGVRKFIYDTSTIRHLDAGIWQDAGNMALWGATYASVNQALLLDLARADGPVPQEDILKKGPEADARQTALINMERFHIVHQPQPGAYAIRFGLLRTWLRQRKLGLE